MSEIVLIISESFDKSTNNVMEWLYFNNKKVIRKNVDCEFTKFNIQLNDGGFLKSNLNDYFGSIWNRRGYIPILPIQLKGSQWIDYLKKEQLPVLFAIERSTNSKYLGSYEKELSNNKILNLKEASLLNIKIPKTIITNNKYDLLQFIEKDKQYITKSLNQVPSLETKEMIFEGNGTSILNFDEITDIFAPSLIQEYVEKEFEIRVFFILETFFSMAIFSQNDTKTKIDYRNYNNEQPNRNVPFILPDHILKKLKKFTKKIECDTGSIDLIFTPKGEYVFLEINPMGQYDWLSIDCNYYIDKHIAEILISKFNHGRKN